MGHILDNAFLEGLIIIGNAERVGHFDFVLQVFDKSFVKL